MKTVTIITSKGRGEAKQWSVKTTVSKPETPAEWDAFWAKYAPGGLHNELAFDALIVYSQGAARRAVEGNEKKGIAPKIGSERESAVSTVVQLLPYNGSKERVPQVKRVKVEKPKGIADSAWQNMLEAMKAQGVEIAE